MERIGFSLNLVKILECESASINVNIEEPYRLNRIVTSHSGEFKFSPPGTCHFEILLLGVTIMNWEISSCDCLEMGGDGLLPARVGAGLGPAPDTVTRRDSTCAIPPVFVTCGWLARDSSTRVALLHSSYQHTLLSQGRWIVGQWLSLIFINISPLSPFGMSSHQTPNYFLQFKCRSR